MIDWTSRAAAIFQKGAGEAPTKLTELPRREPTKPTEPATRSTDKTDETSQRGLDRGVSSVSSVGLGRVLEKANPSPDPHPEAIGALADRIEAFEERAGILEFDGGMDRRSAESEALRLLSLLVLRGRWTPDDIADGHEVVARNAADAAELFRDMLGRLPEPDPDTRVRCLDCRHYRQSHCNRHKRAGLSSPMVGPDLAALHQTCPAFEHGPGPQLVRQPTLPCRSPAPAKHLETGWAAYQRCLRWLTPYMQTLEAHGWSEAEVQALPTNRAGTDGGLAWALAGFDLDRLEVSATTVVAITTSGSRMTARKQTHQPGSTE